jgi:CRP/FNR family cyclic AMP-dependent transcriptional regulator
MYRQADITSILQTIPWFIELKSLHFEQLASISHIQELNAGEELFSEGGKEDYLYIVLEGQIAIEIHVPTRGSARIFTAEPLDIIGWSTLTPVVRQRTSTARALFPSRVLGLEAEGLKKLCEDDHSFGYIIITSSPAAC